jgi:hypothetical protein
MEQRHRSAPRRRGRTLREPLLERATENEMVEDRRDMSCVRLLQRTPCLRHQRPSE